MGSLVSRQVEGPSTRITMDDGKLNVLSPQMLAELHEALAAARAEGGPVVLSGREGVLSAGFDLKVLTGGGSEAADLLHAGFTLSEQMLSFPAPLVVACTGHAIAMGLFLVLSGDYRIAVSGPYRLTANEVAIGMTLPRTPTELCRYRVAPGCFDRAVALSEVFSPDTALTAGIVDRVVEADGLDDAVEETVARLAGLDMAAHQATKLRARAGLLATMKEAIAADDADFRALIARTAG